MASWRRGSTPTNTFTVNVDLREAKIYVSYSQDGEILVEKTGDDLEVDETSIVVHLTQAETLRFKTGSVSIQIRYVMPDESADASNIMTVSSERILKDGEIKYV